MKPSFWQVARQPKWLAGLALAILVAVLFSLFGNWQLSRSIRVTTDDKTLASTIELGKLAQPNEPFIEPQADRRVSETLWLWPSSCVVVANRQQLLADGTAETGFWTVFDAAVDISPGAVHVVVANAFFKTADAASRACSNAAKASLAFDTPFAVVARYEPSEAPKPSPVSGVELFDSLSVEQLINVWSYDRPPVVYPGFVISESTLVGPLAEGGEPIKIGIRKSQTEVNLLNAFYAIEWVLFAGFAVFLWGRLVQDERKRLETETAEATETTETPASSGLN